MNGDKYIKFLSVSIPVTEILQNLLSVPIVSIVVFKADNFLSKFSKK